MYDSIGIEFEIDEFIKVKWHVFFFTVMIVCQDEASVPSHTLSNQKNIQKTYEGALEAWVIVDHCVCARVG